RTFPPFDAAPPRLRLPDRLGSTETPVVDLIRTGARGEDVRDVQHRLLRAGLRIEPDELDGTFGDSTEAAVREFQRARGLPPDGIIGPDTWGQLVETGYRRGAPHPSTPLAAC